MISTDFAPNEDGKDAAAGLWMGIRFLDWRKGQYTGKIKAHIKRMFPGQTPFFFFTARGALYKLLQSIPELVPGDEVLVLGFTCEAVVLPVKALKLKPVFVDIEKVSFSLDPRSAKEKLTSRTRVIIIQHTYGITPQRDELMSLAKKHGLIVIEDLAHGFDRSLFHDNPSDSIKLLSFGRNKSISSVYGGALIIPETKPYKKLIHQMGIVQKSLPFPGSFQIWQLLGYKSLSVLIKKTYSWFFIGKIIHGVTRLLQFIPDELSQKERKGIFDGSVVKAYPNALAYLLYIQFKKSEQVYKKRVQACYNYNSYFKDPNTKYAHITRYPLLVKNRDKIVESLRRKQIYIGKWYSYPQSKPAECPVTDEVCGMILNLPTNIRERDAVIIAKEVLKLQSP